MLLIYSLHHSQAHVLKHETMKHGHNFGLTASKRRESHNRPGWAYSSSYKRDLSQKVAAIFHSLGNKVRACFSRDFKPIDHLGGVDPEKRLLLVNDIDPGLERWPKVGNTFEGMDICV